MKLYEVPRNTIIRIIDEKVTVPQYKAVPAKQDELLKFEKIDGMYSRCYNKNKQVVHLAAWTEVEVVEKEYDAVDFYNKL